MPKFWPFNAYLKIDEARFITAFAIALLLQLSVDAEARADDPHLGIIEYELSCMPCHGIEGRGDGPRAKTLKTAPADLTQIARYNKGKFPRQKVVDIIDGRTTVPAHGQREMPVWGDRYRTSAQTNEPGAWIDRRVREQIAALAKYLEILQER